MKRAEDTASIVCDGDRRKYYRFRPARFYGGIATADCVGCCLRCIFCWSYREVVKPENYGEFLSPEEVSGRLVSIVRKKRFGQVRVSGNEPTIGREHLLEVLELIPSDIQFILETNGILIGHDKTYAEDLSRFENLYVRVSLKGTSEEEFSILTRADPSGFTLQLQALDNLYWAGVNVHPAAMVSFSPRENIQALAKRLRRIHRSFADVEIEELVLYGDVEERLRRAKIGCGRAYDPREIPPGQV